MHFLFTLFMFKRVVVFLTFLVLPLLTRAQSETTSRFHQDHEEAFTLFFYHNTLRMMNMTDDPDFHEMIKDIDKMKFLRLDKEKDEVDNQELNDLIARYHQESFDDLMNMRSEGMKFNIFIQEKNKVTTGLVILFEDKESFSILDIKGAVPLSRIAELATKISDAVEGGGFNFKNK